MNQNHNKGFFFIYIKFSYVEYIYVSCIYVHVLVISIIFLSHDYYAYGLKFSAYL